ncbi:MAG TPA: Ig-like domain-containing protein [Candidatus Limnocylindrales bacterium]|nr:Ig-like domain-containing protein [Candidatus Limnocylindrales bacterium]
MVQLGSVLVAVAALAVVLYNATLVDRRPPSVGAIALSAPVAGDPRVGQTLTAIDVEFSEPVRTATAEQRFAIEPYVAGTFSWDGATMIYTPSQRLPPDATFSVTIGPGFQDLAGNTAPGTVDPWQFRTVGPPIVTEVQPADGSPSVAVTTTIRLTFDRLMDTASVEQATTMSPEVPYHASWSGQTVMLALDAPLSFDTDYTLTVGAAARDTGGSLLREPFVVHFRTVEAGLGIASLIPAPNVSGVSVRTPIAVAFDGPIDSASISGALRITPSVGGDLRVVALPEDRPAAPASPSAAPSASETPPAGSVLELIPGAPLAAHTTYTVTLDPIVRGARTGAGVAASRTWTFTTGAPSQSAQNQIAFLSNRGGVRNVWLMNPDGSNQRELTAEMVPVTSYDVSGGGDRLAYAAGGVVTVVSIDGADARTITQPGRFEYSPVLGPEARVVYLARRDSSGADLGWWAVPLDPGAGAERQLLPTGAPPLGSVAQTAEILPASDASWTRAAAVSDDRRWLLVVADGSPVVIDLAATDAAAPHRLDLSPTQSPPSWDEAAAAFLVVASAPGETDSSVWRITPDGGLTRVVAGVDSASADAQAGIATIEPGGLGNARHVAYVAPGGSAPDALTTAPDLLDRRPSFAPDGASILFLRVRADDPSASAGIWVVAPDGRELRQLSTDGAEPRWLP